MREVVWRIKSITKRKNYDAKFRAALAGMQFDGADVGEDAPPQTPALSDEKFEALKARTMQRRFGRKENPAHG